MKYLKKNSIFGFVLLATLILSLIGCSNSITSNEGIDDFPITYTQSVGCGHESSSRVERWSLNDLAGFSTARDLENYIRNNEHQFRTGGRVDYGLFSQFINDNVSDFIIEDTDCDMMDLDGVIIIIRITYSCGCQLWVIIVIS